MAHDRRVESRTKADFAARNSVLTNLDHACFVQWSGCDVDEFFCKTSLPACLDHHGLYTWDREAIRCLIITRLFENNVILPLVSQANIFLLSL